MEITFPTTTEAFTTCQEAGAGRKLNDREKELMRRSVEILNDCYEGGRAGKRILSRRARRTLVRFFPTWERPIVGSSHL